MTAPGIFVSQLDQCQRQKHSNPAERRSPHHNKTAGKQSIIGESCHKYYFCREKRQTCLCRDKISNVIFWRQKFCRGKHIFVSTKSCFVATHMCLSRQNTYFVATKVLSRQAYFCLDKHVFVATKHLSSRDNRMLVCRDNTCLSRQKIKRNLVGTNACLSRQKLYLCQLPPMIAKSWFTH